jgi:hypothetical protein
VKRAHAKSGPSAGVVIAHPLDAVASSESDVDPFASRPLVLSPQHDAPPVVVVAHTAWLPARTSEAEVTPLTAAARTVDPLAMPWAVTPDAFGPQQATFPLCRLAQTPTRVHAMWLATIGAPVAPTTSTGVE